MVEHFVAAAAALAVALILFGLGYSFGFWRGYNARRHYEKMRQMLRACDPLEDPLSTSKRPTEPWMAKGHGVQHWG